MTTPEATDDPPMPVLDQDGLLRLGSRWVAISDVQLPVVALLLDRLGRLVRGSEILAAYVTAGGSGSEASLRSLVHRVRCRLGELGLELRSVRGRGFVLDLAPPGTPPEVPLLG